MSEYEIMCRDLPDGRHACLIPMTYGKTRLVVTSPEYKHMSYDDGW